MFLIFGTGAAGGGVDDENGVGHVGYDAVTFGAGGGGDAANLVREWGEDGETAGGNGFNESGRRLRKFATGKAPNNGTRAAQEDPQAFLFHGGMEAADDAVTGVPPLGGLVVGAENQVAGAPGGAK